MKEQSIGRTDFSGAAMKTSLSRTLEIRQKQMTRWEGTEVRNSVVEYSLKTPGKVTEGWCYTNWLHFYFKI